MKKCTEPLARLLFPTLKGPESVWLKPLSLLSAVALSTSVTAHCRFQRVRHHLSAALLRVQGPVMEEPEPWPWRSSSWVHGGDSRVPPRSGKVAQSSPTLCDSIDCTAHGILQARILQWGAFSFPRGSSQPGIEPRCPALQADCLPAEPPGKPQRQESVVSG